MKASCPELPARPTASVGLVARGPITKKEVRASAPYRIGRGLHFFFRLVGLDGDNVSTRRCLG